MYLRDKPFMDSMHEECGVFGIYTSEARHIADTVYYGLYALQHRGQESCGIAVAEGDSITYYRDSGLVPEVFAGGNLSLLPEGNIAIGHVRYSTSGNSLSCNAQPLVFTGKCGRMAIAHNGNIVNSAILRRKLIDDNVVFQTSIDTEVIAALINKYTDNCGDVVTGIVKASREFVGSYALTIMTTDKLIAVRDMRGMRPLVLGRAGDDYIIASETCALDAVNAEFVRDILPGEIVVIDKGGIKSQMLPAEKSSLCIFEFVYFARPDSFIDGSSVYQARKAAGHILAKKFPVDADIVSGVPDSAIIAARGYAETSGIPYVESLNKNRYVGRTFIQPEQGAREIGVSIKMNAIKANIKGKRIVLIDDSIVRGTTSRKIVDLLRKMGAKEVHIRICSPIIKHPCFFGIDIQSSSQLIASNYDCDEVCNYIGADSLAYLEIEDLAETVKDCNLDFCMGCFNGKYPMDISGIEIDREKF